MKKWFSAIACVVILLLLLPLACDDHKGGSSDIPALPQKIAYIAYQKTSETYELFVVNEDGTGRVKLNDTPVSGGMVLCSRWSPDGSRIAYLADQDVDDVFELFAVNPDGTGLVKLNDSPVSGGIVQNFKWSPDGSRIAYLADQDADEVFELYSVNPDGTGREKLSGALVGGGDVTRYEWSYDGSYIAFIADKYTDETYELFVFVRDYGMGVMRLNGGLVDGGDVENFKWSPTENIIVYKADQDTDNQTEIYQVDSSLWSKKMNAPLESGELIYDYSWSPDGSKIFYEVMITFWEYELYSMNHDATEPVFLNTARGFYLSWSPDSSMIAYVAHKDNGHDLCVSNMESNELVTFNNVRIGSSIRHFSWSPDGSTIAYVGDLETEGVNELFCSRPDGSGMVKLSVPLETDAFVDDYCFWSPDGSRIIYGAGTKMKFEKYSVKPDGTGTVRFDDGRKWNKLEWSPNGGRIAYFLDENTDYHFNLYSVKAGGTGRVKLNDTLASDGSVISFEWCNQINQKDDATATK